ncbi:hypothetical protein HanIR_Chr12g0586121 [Helianthus annuus]|nr:hypothetical protein HanIR_Chr12g0586121 [Helianthus annuus]
MISSRDLVVSSYNLMVSSRDLMVSSRNLMVSSPLSTAVIVISLNQLILRDLIIISKYLMCIYPS